MSVYILFGPPGQGKSWYATYVAIEEMLRGTRVFTNFPIIFDKIQWVEIVKNLFRRKKDRKPWKKTYRSYQFKNEYINEGLYDTVIIVDEAYRAFNSRNWKDFGLNTHEFFATNRHNLNDMWVMAQGYQRVDKVIREMTNYYIYMRKKSFPQFIPFIGGLPVVFIAEYYLEESDFSNRKMVAKAAEFKKFHFFIFNLRTNLAYDTHYFRKHPKREFYDLWADERKASLTFKQLVKVVISQNIDKLIVFAFLFLAIYRLFLRHL